MSGPMVFKANCYGDSSSQCGSLVPGCLVCGLLLSSLHICRALPLTVSWVSLVPYHVFSLSTIFNVASSLHLAVESLLCQSLSHFLGYLYCCGCYLCVSVGWGEPRILLLSHLPQKSCDHFPTIFKLSFSWFSICLVVINLWLFSRVLAKLVLTVGICSSVFLWRNRSLELSTLPFFWYYQC